MVTLVLIWGLFQFNVIENYLEARTAGYLNEVPYWVTRRLVSFGLEVIVCLVHDVPFLKGGVDISYTEQEFPYMTAYQGVGTLAPNMLPQPWSLFMFLRYYLYMRVMRDSTFSAGTVCFVNLSPCLVFLCHRPDFVV